MKRILLVLLALMIWSAPPAYSQGDPEQILELALSNYNYVPSEIEYSTISTFDWGKETIKYCTSWIRRNQNGKNEMMLVLNQDRKLMKQPEGVIIFSDNGYLSKNSVIFQTRKSIKNKGSGFDSNANSTELNYFDLARMGGETVKILELFPWREKPNRDLGIEIVSSIKAVPKNPQAGDYAFRVFHVGIFQDMAVIAAIECYDSGSRLVKSQLNSDFERLEFENVVIVREKIRHIISAQTGKETFIKVIGRELGAEFGEINKAALVAGKVR